MPEFAYLTATEALRNVLNGQHTFAAATANAGRQDAATEVRRVTEDRIYVGRRPGTQRPWISIDRAGRESIYNAEDGLSDNTPEFISVTVYSEQPEERERLTAAITAALDFFKGGIDTDKGEVDIGSCLLENPSDNPPEKHADGSDDWEFEAELTFRVTYCR